MDTEQARPSVGKMILRNSPRIVASLGMGRAFDGQAGISDALGWWVTGWKTIVAGLTFEALGHYKKARGQGSEFALSDFADRFRGSRGLALASEATLCAYAIHEALGATVYRGEEVSLRSVLYSTAAIYGASVLGRIRN